ncbi:MAG: hypothetical protein ISS48_05085 [Candidatus Aenigmarchaeota archaeon]|nr:hypothetical protein [Candidatus Aenigmarchaeota archaeon]
MRKIVLVSVVLLLICSSVFALSLNDLTGGGSIGDSILSFFSRFANFFANLFGLSSCDSPDTCIPSSSCSQLGGTNLGFKNNCGGTGSTLICCELPPESTPNCRAISCTDTNKWIGGKCLIEECGCEDCDNAYECGDECRDECEQEEYSAYTSNYAYIIGPQETEDECKEETPPSGDDCPAEYESTQARFQAYLSSGDMGPLEKDLKVKKGTKVKAVGLHNYDPKDWNDVQLEIKKDQTLVETCDDQCDLEGLGLGTYTLTAKTKKDGEGFYTESECIDTATLEVTQEEMSCPYSSTQARFNIDGVLYEKKTVDLEDYYDGTNVLAVIQAVGFHNYDPGACKRGGCIDINVTVKGPDGSIVSGCDLLQQECLIVPRVEGKYTLTVITDGVTGDSKCEGTAELTVK